MEEKILERNKNKSEAAYAYWMLIVISAILATLTYSAVDARLGNWFLAIVVAVIVCFILVLLSFLFLMVIEIKNILEETKKR